MVETGGIGKLRLVAFHFRPFEPQRSHISRVMAHFKWGINLDIDSIFPMEIEFLKIGCYLLWHPRIVFDLEGGIYLLAKFLYTLSLSMSCVCLHHCTCVFDRCGIFISEMAFEGPRGWWLRLSQR